MADASGQPMDWRSQAFRRRVIQQIEDAVRIANTPMTKSSMEMENHVFLKAKTRDEYMALVARLILHVKGMNSQKEKETKSQMGAMGMAYPQQQQQQGISQGPYQGANIAAMQQPANPIQELQNLARQGATTMPGQQTVRTTLQQTQQQQQLQRQQMQQILQQRSAAAQQQQRPQLQRQDAFIVTSAQNVQVQPVSQQLPQQQQPQQQQPPVTYQFQQGPPSGGPQQQRQIPGGPMTTMPQQNFQQSGLQQQMISQPNMSAVPSPAQPGSQITSSPMAMSMMSPSPQSNVVPSPASRVSGVYGVPSPSNVSLNTPAAPGQPQTMSEDDSAYLEKLSQMSKYVEPLRRMINRRMMNRQSDKDEDRMKEIYKMKNLLEILTDPKKRLPWATLLKCEQVLLKLEIEWTTPNPDTVVTKPAITTTLMCQPLLDAVAANIKSPMLNHSLHRTFGPAITALHGSPIKAPSPPPKRQKREMDEEEEDEIPHILQSEIASLGSRFRVNFDPSQHGSSKDIHLLCRLDDRNLPSIPPISVKVPESYPAASPQCDTKAVEYESNTFFQNIQQTLAILLLKMPDKFTFTELLDKWEMSVRKACAKAV